MFKNISATLLFIKNVTHNACCNYVQLS